MSNKLTFPRYLSIQTTSVCNASCVFCPYQEIKNLFPAQTMEINLYKKIIDECSKHKETERIILYMNNEPLTDKYIIEKINYAKEKIPGAGVHFLTNGLLLDDRMADQLINSRLDWLGISFHGIRKETIEKTMGISYDLAFNRINKFIEKAKKNKNLKEYLMVTLLKHKYLSEKEKNQAIKFWKDKGIERISYFKRPISRAGNVEGLPKVYNQDKITGCKSIWADEMLHIVEDGRVVLCCMDWKREVILGDLNNQTVKEVWQGKRKKIWEMIQGQSQMPAGFLCRRCEEAAIKKEKVSISRDSRLKEVKEIVLVILPCWGVDNPPLSLAALEAYLRSKGVGLRVLDLNVQIYNRVSKELKRLWDMENSHLWWDSSFFYEKIKPVLNSQIEWAANKLADNHIFNIGFSVYAPNRLFTKEVIKAIRKRRQKNIIVGGRGIYDAEERRNFPSGLVDYYIVGEAEESLYQFLQGKKNAEGVIKDRDKQISPVFLKSISDLPLITYKDFDLSQYKEKIVCLLMNRGCVLKCAFCNDWRYIGKLRSRRAEDVYKEIEYLFYNKKVKKFFFNDQAINVNRQLLENLSDLLIQAPFQIEWVALAIAWRFLTFDLLRKMRKAGCITLNYGIESGSNKVLKLMNKDFTVLEAEKVLSDTRRAGINTQVNFIVGFPGETQHDFTKTGQFIKRNQENISGITNLNMCNVTFGADLFINKESYGIVLPLELEKMDTHWFTQDIENTYEVRLSRLRQLLKQVKNQNLKVFTTNLPKNSFSDGHKGATVYKEYGVLLINLPPWGVDNPPLAEACISSYLQAKNIEVDIFDMNIELYNGSLAKDRYLWSMNYSHLWRQEKDYAKIRRLLDSQINYLIGKIINSDKKIVGFSLPTNCSVFILREIAEKIKNSDNKKIIIAGGGSVSIKEQREELNHIAGQFIDYYVAGEGEEVLYKIVERLGQNNLNDIENLEGVFTKEKNKGCELAQIKNLNSLPYPSFDKFDLKKYQSPESLPMEFSRGCVGRCPYCAFKTVSPVFRIKSASYLFHEIRSHQQKYGMKHVSFSDAAINGSPVVLEKLCDLLIEEKVKVKMAALAIPRQEMTLALLKKMYRAGFYRLEYGVESGSDKILGLMRKIFTVEIAQQVIKDSSKAGIKIYLYFIVGYPGESKEDFSKTKEFLKKVSSFVTMIKSINPLYIMAGSELFYRPEKYGINFGEKNRDMNWFSKDSTIEIRRKRVKELKSYANQLKISFTEEAEHLEFTVGSELLLVICPMWDISLPPLGISYLASYLEKRGIRVDILDMNIETYANSSPQRKNLWRMDNYNLWAWEDLFEDTLSYFREDINTYVEKIIEKNYKIIGFSLYGANTLFSIEVAKRLKAKNPNLFIVFGGTACSFPQDNPDIPVRNMVSFKTGIVDAFVVGEGEEALLNIIINNQRGKTDSIPGVFFRHDRYNQFTMGNLIKQLDKIPFPSWDKLPLALYQKKNVLPILFGRGCVNKCTFCNDWKIWRGCYRNRSAEDIYKEMVVNIEKFGVTAFQSNDLLINANIKMLERLADFIIGSKYKINWVGQATINKNMSKKLLSKLNKSGLQWITYGIESLSDKVLRQMNKKYTFEDIKETLKKTKKAGIGVSVNFIVGFPNETQRDFELTKNRLTLISKYINNVSSLNPCHITADTELEKRPQDFSVYLPKKKGYYLWETINGDNYYKVRKERTKELFCHLQNTGIKVNFIGIYDEQEELGKEESKLKSIEEDEFGNYDILFINLPPWAQDNPHIGIGYLCSYLRKRGVLPRVVDLNKRFFLNYPEYKMLWHVENKNFWSNPNTYPLIADIFKEGINQAISEIVKANPLLVGISVVDPKERLAIDFIRRIKKRLPDSKIILGGPAVSTASQRQIFLDEAGRDIDLFVIGEGEERCYEVINRVKQGRSLEKINGTIVKKVYGWEETFLKPSKSIEQIPFPTYQEFDMKSYGKSLLVEWSRGCHNRCSFCKNWRLFPFYRVKEPEKVIDELKYQINTYGIRKFTVVDSILNGNPDKLYQICSLIIDNDLDIEWSGQIAPSEKMSYSFFKHMHQAGCRQLQIGVESADNRVLKKMRKSYTVQMSQKTIQNAKRAGIETEIFIIIGFPGEDESAFEKTFDFIKKNREHIDTIKSINTLHLVAGTEVYERSQDFNMKPLPDKQWHFLWETYDGNNYEVRKKRAERLLELAEFLGIKVMEANIREGKEEAAKKAMLACSDGKELNKIFKNEINRLQVLPEKRRKQRRKRSVVKWIFLLILYFYTLSYIIYFWIYMCLYGKVLLGGEVKKRR